MKCHLLVIGLSAGLGFATLSSGQQAPGSGNANKHNEHSKIQIGFAIAPVPLDLAGKNPALVGLGSYIVNAQGDCAGCRSNPQYADGGNPHLGEPTVVDQAGYLVGGADLFGPFVPRNLTPNRDGQPAGLTLDHAVAGVRPDDRSGEAHDLRISARDSLSGDRRALQRLVVRRKVADEGRSIAGEFKMTLGA